MFIYLFIGCRQTDRQNIPSLGQMEKCIFLLSTFFASFFRYRCCLWPMCEWVNERMIDRNMQIDWTMFVTRHINSCFVADGIIHEYYELMYDIFVMCLENSINTFISFCSVVNHESGRKKVGTSKRKTKTKQTPITYSIGWISIQWMYIWSVPILPCYRHLIRVSVYTVVTYSVVWALSRLNNSPAFLYVNSFPLMLLYFFAF